MSPGRLQKAIIIIGGYNSLWPAYLKMARDLEDLTGLRAVGVPAMIWDWRRAERRRDATNLLQKLDETVAWARRRFGSQRFILVGHSAGGILARLYLCPQPVWGKTYAGLECVTEVITLGSPHLDGKGTATGWFLSDKANRLAPGVPSADTVRFTVVAGRHIRGREKGTYRERRAFRLYNFFAGQGNIWGDGMIPVRCAGLDGTETLVLDGVAHSRKIGRTWYGGSKAIVRRWWPHGSGSGPSCASLAPLGDVRPEGPAQGMSDAN